MIAQDANIVIQPGQAAANISSLAKDMLIWDYASSAPVRIFNIYQKTFNFDQLRKTNCMPHILAPREDTSGQTTLAVSPSQAVFQSDPAWNDCVLASDICDQTIDFVHCTYYVIVPRKSAIISANGHLIRVLGLSDVTGSSDMESVPYAKFQLGAANGWPSLT